MRALGHEEVQVGVEVVQEEVGDVAIEEGPDGVEDVEVAIEEGPDEVEDVEVEASSAQS